MALHWIRLASGDRLCVEHPVLLVKPLSRTNDDGWEVRVPSETSESSGLDRGDGWWWRSMWDEHGGDLLLPNLREAVGLIEECFAHPDQTGRELAGWIAEARSQEPWTEERREKIVAKAKVEEDRWQKRLAEIGVSQRPRPSVPKKTSRADLISMLDEAYDLLRHRHHSDSMGLSSRDSEAEALLTRIRQIRN